mmetsp:Transcript_8567/g.23806  ORF Transcript_8567/g.23806 Transcript_8567/m.23806 type:complete len:213 (-) Transcript_8567:1339-1977(-)
MLQVPYESTELLVHALVLEHQRRDPPAIRGTLQPCQGVSQLLPVHASELLVRHQVKQGNHLRGVQAQSSDWLHDVRVLQQPLEFALPDDGALPVLVAVAPEAIPDPGRDLAVLVVLLQQGKVAVRFGKLARALYEDGRQDVRDEDERKRDVEDEEPSVERGDLPEGLHQRRPLAPTGDRHEEAGHRPPDRPVILVQGVAGLAGGSGMLLDSL